MATFTPGNLLKMQNVRTALSYYSFTVFENKTYDIQ